MASASVAPSFRKTAKAGAALVGVVGAIKTKDKANVKSGGQECAPHNISVILSGAKDPAAAGTAGEAARHSHDAAGSIVRMP
jgi:hypothetical protein